MKWNEPYEYSSDKITQLHNHLTENKMKPVLFKGKKGYYNCSNLTVLGFASKSHFQVSDQVEMAT